MAPLQQPFSRLASLLVFALVNVTTEGEQVTENVVFANTVPAPLTYGQNVTAEFICFKYGS